MVGRNGSKSVVFSSNKLISSFQLQMPWQHLCFTFPWSLVFLVNFQALNHSKQPWLRSLLVASKLVERSNKQKIFYSFVVRVTSAYWCFLWVLTLSKGRKNPRTITLPYLLNAVHKPEKRQDPEATPRKVGRDFGSWQLLRRSMACVCFSGTCVSQQMLPASLCVTLFLYVYQYSYL